VSQVSLPPTVSRGVRTLIEDRLGGTPDELVATPVCGGCINNAARVEFGTTDTLFLKWNSTCPRDFFAMEARGLVCLAERSRLKVPDVLGWSETEGSEPQWLALEYVARGRPSPDFAVHLGEGLAALHAEESSASFGWPYDNYIGAIPQCNEEDTRWSEFWLRRRLTPQFERAQPYLSDTDARNFRRLTERLDGLLAPGQDEPPSFLHGDLWSGNVYAGADGSPVLIDPAVYVGHREVDIAMTELFGGFSGDFYHAYQSAAPLCSGYDPQRRHIYQLYPLLVHLNLFGSGYVGSVRKAMSGALA